MRETALWGPPRDEKPCCDGVLGADFFQVYQVEQKSPRDSSIVLIPQGKVQSSPATGAAHGAADLNSVQISRGFVHEMTSNPVQTD